MSCPSAPSSRLSTANSTLRSSTSFCPLGGSGDDPTTPINISGSGSFLAFQGRNRGVGIDSRSSMSLTLEGDGGTSGLPLRASSIGKTSARSARTRVTVSGCGEWRGLSISEGIAYRANLVWGMVSPQVRDSKAERRQNREWLNRLAKPPSQPSWMGTCRSRFRFGDPAFRISENRNPKS